ncbi:MAG: hypothetical protein MZW92_22815 [Comamonadaceae bacterium]|nr:hypothetical protein [Comamonadaceae bacterium]
MLPAVVDIARRRGQAGAAVHDERARQPSATVWRLRRQGRRPTPRSSRPPTSRR